MSNVDTVKEMSAAVRWRGHRRGTPFSLPYEGHLWVFNDAGKVVKLQHETDTATHWRMAHM